MRRTLMVTGLVLTAPATLYVLTLVFGSRPAPDASPEGKAPSGHAAVTSEPLPALDPKPTVDRVSKERGQQDHPSASELGDSATEARRAIQEEQERLDDRIATTTGDERAKLQRYRAVLKRIDASLQR